MFLESLLSEPPIFVGMYVYRLIQPALKVFLVYCRHSIFQLSFASLMTCAFLLTIKQIFDIKRSTVRRKSPIFMI